MNELDPVDLSPLDPAREPERWARLMEAVRFRAEAALAGRRHPAGSLDIVAGWFRPILAAAAILAAVLGAAGAIVKARSDALDRASESQRLAVLSEDALGRGQRPTGAQLLVALRSRSAP
jgi:hypothetical protein